MIAIPMITVLVCRSSLASEIRKPRPLWEATNSAASSESQAAPKPSLTQRAT